MLEINEEISAGFDCGDTNLGFAAVDDKNILTAGVVVFPGPYKSSNTLASIRNGQKSARKLTERKKQRKQTMFNCLIKSGILPYIEEKDKNKRLNAIIGGIDVGEENRNKKVYFLRTKALDKKLSKEELGYVLYNFMSKRGYLSNRKDEIVQDTDGDEIKDTQKVLKGIDTLRKSIYESKYRTLGEYFFHYEGIIRGKGVGKNKGEGVMVYTSRKMHQDEFDAIIESQTRFHPKILTKKTVGKLRDIIFYQRPLKSCKHLVGYCEYEKKSRRCSKAKLCFQEFRLLQYANNVKVVKNGEKRDLTKDERDIFINALTLNKSVSHLPDLLNLESEEKINYEDKTFNKNKSFEGDKTSASLSEIFGDWYNFNSEKKNVIVNEVLNAENDESLAYLGRRKYGLNMEESLSFSKVRLEEGYGYLSTKALLKINELLRKKTPYSSAIKKLYGEQIPLVYDELPVLEDVVSLVANPRVRRVLSIGRKVTNKIVSQIGKPGMLCVELSGDLKNNKKARNEHFNRNKENKKENAEASKFLISKGISNPSRQDIKKYKLWKESGYQCLVQSSGEIRSIGFNDVFGSCPAVQMDHIIPRSRVLNDSLDNLMLITIEENNGIKGDQTPYESFGEDEELWALNLENAKRLWGEKSRRYSIYSEEDFDTEEFSSRQLNDVRYSSRVMKEYLGCLYGCDSSGVDVNGKKRVMSIRSGALTARFRDNFSLNSILSGTAYKDRQDYRHNAIDAIAIAVMGKNPKMVEQLIRQEPVDEPWEGFRDSVVEAIDSIQTFHYVKRKTNGQLHEETFLSKDGRSHKYDKDSKKIVRKRNSTGGNAYAVGSGSAERYVLLKNNNHIEVFKSKKGKWLSRTVARIEAMSRVKDKISYIDKVWDDNDFKFYLRKGDTFSLGGADNFVITKFSGDTVGYLPVNKTNISGREEPILDKKTGKKTKGKNITRNKSTSISSLMKKGFKRTNMSMVSFEK